MDEPLFSFENIRISSRCDTKAPASPSAKDSGDPSGGWGVIDLGEVREIRDVVIWYLSASATFMRG